jgi:hypothetical protein
MAQFDALSTALNCLAATQVPNIVQWVYACPRRGCMEFHISERPNVRRVCTMHQANLAYVGDVLEVNGTLYARRRP